MLSFLSVLVYPFFFFSVTDFHPKAVQGLNKSDEAAKRCFAPLLIAGAAITQFNIFISILPIVIPIISIFVVKVVPIIIDISRVVGIVGILILCYLANSAVKAIIVICVFIEKCICEMPCHSIKLVCCEIVTCLIPALLCCFYPNLE